MGKWIKDNAINLILAAVILVLAFKFFGDKSANESVQAIKAIILVVFGLGFVIFFHELGHFAAAKWCGVRVHTFSVGFGPAIPGCSFKKGETEYRLASFPLGGYVQMLGQDDPGVEAKEGFTEDDPRSFKNKTVGQRMLIIAAGVIMNVILGLVIFVYVYMAGKTDVTPRFGLIDPGSPADAAGMQMGSELLQIDDNHKPNYEDLFFRGAFATPDQTEIFMRWRTPTGEEREAVVVPRRKEGDLKPLIGVAPPDSLKLFQGMKEGKSPALANTPAAKAAFRSGDKLVGVHAEGEKEFRPLKTRWELAKAEYELRGKLVVFQVERPHGKTPDKVEVPVQPAFVVDLGLIMEMGPIVSVGASAPEVAKVLKKGDVIVAVNGDAKFDPMRLPDQMAAKAGKDVELTVRRGEKSETLKVKVKPVKDRFPWIEEIPLGPSSPLGVPSLGIACAVKTTVKSVVKGSAAEGKIAPGDVIATATLKANEDAKAETIKLAAEQWPGLFWMLQRLGEKKVDLLVERTGGKATETVTLTAGEDKSWPLPGIGFFLERDTQTIHAESVGEAISLGFRDTVRSIGRIYLNLKGLLTGILSPKLVSGPIAILEMSYNVAQRGVNDLILFLGMISINLAVINFLPIPVLDGGHMVFLIVEKIRGKPASDRAFIIANTIGIVLLGSLMLFVIGMDISKKF